MVSERNLHKRVPILRLEAVKFCRRSPRNDQKSSNTSKIDMFMAEGQENFYDTFFHREIFFE